MKHKLQFTKTELVVILSCIVFVLANVGAVGTTGRRRAKEMVCACNLKKWGEIWKFYTDDHNGYFPQRNDGMPQWPLTTEQYYAGQRRMLFCPEATQPYAEGGKPPYAAWSSDMDGEVINGSYTINLWASNMSFVPEQDRFWRTPYAKRANSVPLMSDGIWKDVEPEPYDMPPEYENSWWEPNRNEMKRVCVNRHRGAINCVFLDFSVRKVGLKKLWRLKWHPSWPEGYQLPYWPAWMDNFKEP